MTPSPTLRRVERVRHELRRRELQVCEVQPLGPRFVAVSFTGEALDDFVSLSFDDHVKFLFTAAGGDTIGRDYTPRRFDRQRRRLTIEFALHGHGPAADWARMARVGQPVVVGGPRGSMIVPVDYDWHLLAGDSSALPAIHRRLDELPSTTRAVVLLQAGDDDRRPLASAAALDVHWLPDADAWAAALRSLQRPPGEGYVWCAGEASLMARARQIVLTDWRHPREHMRVAAYWKRGAAAHHERLDG